jgi:hypothetical protein
VEEHKKYRAIAELVGVLGVVGSLIFVGLQVRQNASAIRAATAQEVSTGFRDLNLVIASTPELAAILATETIPDSLSPGQREQVSGFWRSIFHVWSNTHYQYINGTLDRVLFEPTLTEVTKYASRDAFRSLWESQRALYNPRFGQFMDSIMTAVPSTSPTR